MSADVRSYVLPPFDSVVQSISGEYSMKAYLASIPETQRALGIGRSTTYRLIDSGKLERVKIGRRTLIKIASIRALAGELQDGAIGSGLGDQNQGEGEKD